MSWVLTGHLRHQDQFGEALVEVSPGKSLYYVTRAERAALAKAKNWKHNRPADAGRVDEIVRSGRVDGVIMLADLESEGLVCYDGNNRREAFLSEQSDLPYALVQVWWTATRDGVVAEFQDINKAIPVPELFIPQEDPELDACIKQEIVQTVRKLVEIWPQHSVASNRPRRPNFNRDVLTDTLYNHVRDKALPNTDLLSRLLAVNQKLKTRDKARPFRVSGKADEAAYKKCLATGCFLFLEKENLLVAP